MAKYETNIAIVGGGASGLAAAVYAAQKGESVIVIEKMGVCGGCGNMAAGVLAYQSHLQREAQETMTVEEGFRRHMEFTHYRANAPLTKRVFERSSELISWLEDLGVEFAGVYKNHPSGQRVWHIVKVPGGTGPVDRAASIMMKALTDKASSLGVQFLFNTEGKEILMEDGCAVGVLAQNEKGQRIEVLADAVIVATNGFQADSPMGKDLFGDRWLGEAVVGGHPIPGLTGDGMRMLWKAGTAKAPLSMSFRTAINGVSDKFETLHSVMTQFGLIVDLSGRRVMNEEYAQDPEFLGQQLVLAQDHKLFSIVDTEQLERYSSGGLDWFHPLQTVKKLKNWASELETFEEEQSIFEEDDPEFAEFFEEVNMEPGNFWVCESIEEIAEKTGIDATQMRKTIEAYNADAGRTDRLFFKRAEYMDPVRKAPFYVAAHTITALESRGGVLTDEDMRCLRKDHRAIPGLYCTGTDANSIMGDAASFHRIFGASLTFAMTSAMIAVDDISRYFEEEFD